MWRWVLVGCAAGLVGVSASAQTGSGGGVTGTVILGDTQHPARFAQVQLQAVASGSTGDQGRRDFEGFFGGANARTGVDGTFAMSGVSPGDYYVLASAPGYISERALLQAAANAGATAADLAAQVPMVHVSAGGSGSVVVTLQRGGSIGGKLQWEDGSPATGIQVMADPAVAQVALPQPYASLRGGGVGMLMQSDDRGAFHISGLPSGDYVLHAVIVPYGYGLGQGRQGSGINVYAPGVFHKAEAKPIPVRAGDDRDDVRMVLNLVSLRTVSGHVGSAVAGVSVLSGRVSMADSDGGVQVGGLIDGNGDFVVSYAPPGTYTLTVQGSSMAVTGGFRGGRGRGTTSSTAGATFQTYTQTLTVGDTDVTGLGISLVQAKPQ